MTTFQDQEPTHQESPDQVSIDSTWRDRIVLTSTTVRTFQMRAIALLVVLSTIGQLVIRWLGDVPGLQYLSWLLFVDSEQSFPALYSTAILLSCGAMAAIVGWIIDDVSDRTGWRALAVVMAGAGFDEYAAAHEKAIEPMREALAISDGIFYYAWIIPGLAAVVLLAVVFSGFLRRLPTDTRNRFVTAGVVFVVGAIGFEAIAAGYVTGWMEDVGIGLSPGADPDAARTNLTYLLFTTIEESLEMIGAAILLTAIVSHMETHLGRRLTGALLPLK